MSGGAVATNGLSKDQWAPIDPGHATRAFKDAMRHMAVGVPDPEIYARCMPLAEVEMLLKARYRADGWMVSYADAKRLRPTGLVEAGEKGRCLTAFGIHVLRWLRVENA